MTSSGHVYGFRDWWASSPIWRRVLVIGLPVVVAVIVIWAFIPSEKDRQIDNCVKQFEQTSYQKDTSGIPRQICENMWDDTH
jgi:hypothetical protein